MEAMCANHPEKSARSVCHSCSRSCRMECLTEGLVYYYCAKAECQARLHEEGLPEVVTCPICKEDLELTAKERIEKKFLCPICNQLVDFSEAKATPSDATSNNHVSTPGKVYQEPIGGWLILVAISLVMYPLKTLMGVLKDIAPAFQHDTWSVLTTPGTEAYHPLWAPVLLFELGGKIIFIVFSVVAAVQFFQRKAIAPTLIIVLLVSNFLYVLIDNALAGEIPLVAQQGGAVASQQAMASFFACAIWCTYFLVSKRVKSTFLL